MPLDISRIHAICFDVDGTLRDTDDQYAQRVARILRPLRALLPARDHHAAARLLVMRLEDPVNAFFAFADRIGMDAPLHKLVEWLSPQRREHSPSDFKLVSGVVPLLDSLSARYPLAIVTARSARGTFAFLKHSGLEKYFLHVATALTVSRGKPHPAPILWAARQMDIPPEHCLMVGDTVVDIVAGKAAGAQTVGVLSGFGEEDELRQAGADLILPSVAALADVLAV